MWSVFLKTTRRSWCQKSELDFALPLQAGTRLIVHRLFQSMKRRLSEFEAQPPIIDSGSRKRARSSHERSSIVSAIQGKEALIAIRGFRKSLLSALLQRAEVQIPPGNRRRPIQSTQIKQAPSRCLQITVEMMMTDLFRTLLCRRLRM